MVGFEQIFEDTISQYGIMANMTAWFKMNCIIFWKFF